MYGRLRAPILRVSSAAFGFVLGAPCGGDASSGGARFATPCLHICKEKKQLAVRLDAVLWCLIPVEHAVVAHHVADPQAVVREDTGAAPGLGISVRGQFAPAQD